MCIVTLEYFTYPQEKLRHHHIALLTGSVQGGAWQSQRKERPGGEGPAERAINVLFSAVSQKEQQLWKVVLHHCQEETPGQRDIGALARSGRRQWCNKEFLLIFGPDPRLPIFPGSAKDNCGDNSEHRWLGIEGSVPKSVFFITVWHRGPVFDGPLCGPPICCSPCGCRWRVEPA